MDTLTRFIVVLARMIALIREFLVKRAEKVTQKPIEMSQMLDVHATEAPAPVNIAFSSASGTMPETKTVVPIEIVWRKKG